MIYQFIDIFPHLIKDEGGYVDDPDDFGGRTKYGISQRAYPDEDIKNLTLDRARALYQKDYWQRGRCEELPREIRYIYFDTCVNMGIRTAVKLLQRAAGISDDGVFGKMTLKASENVTLKRYAEERLLQYNSIIKSNPKLEKYRKGWTNRVERILTLNSK